MLLNLQHSFEERQCRHYSLFNFNPFLSIGRPLPWIFMELFWKATEMYQPIGWGEFHFAPSKRVLQIQKHLVLSGLELINLTSKFRTFPEPFPGFRSPQFLLSAFPSSLPSQFLLEAHLLLRVEREGEFFPPATNCAVASVYPPLLCCVGIATSRISSMMTASPPPPRSKVLDCQVGISPTRNICHAS